MKKLRFILVLYLTAFFIGVLSALICQNMFVLAPIVYMWFLRIIYAHNSSLFNKRHYWNSIMLCVFSTIFTNNICYLSSNSSISIGYATNTLLLLLLIFFVQNKINYHSIEYIYIENKQFIHKNIVCIIIIMFKTIIGFIFLFFVNILDSVSPIAGFIIYWIIVDVILSNILSIIISKISKPLVKNCVISSPFILCLIPSSAFTDLFAFLLFSLGLSILP